MIDNKLNITMKLQMSKTIEALHNAIRFGWAACDLVEMEDQQFLFSTYGNGLYEADIIGLLLIGVYKGFPVKAIQFHIDVVPRSIEAVGEGIFKDFLNVNNAFRDHWAEIKILIQYKIFAQLAEYEPERSRTLIEWVRELQYIHELDVETIMSILGQLRMEIANSIP